MSLARAESVTLENNRRKLTLSRAAHVDAHTHVKLRVFLVTPTAAVAKVSVSDKFRPVKDNSEARTREKRAANVYGLREHRVRVSAALTPGCVTAVCWATK